MGEVIAFFAGVMVGMIAMAVVSISRKALLKELREIMDEPHNAMFLMGIGAAVSIIEHREIAFDKEKVIEELKTEGCIIDDEAGNRAVEIVEKGGIE